ncbi:uncharacterized protein LOC110840516 isoform X2 [Zootermopsis nevadensis]|uniref:uncharacterized protein LOC110840516 isoform X2 n=1 Tax=Zootermopsis nevadensis TaxID=136037 RepID=UPI000B8E4C72|nr:uncharacterized protein LOC110840516 isoform X2 [Zootermopsis nevadensis]
MAAIINYRYSTVSNRLADSLPCVVLRNYHDRLTHSGAQIFSIIATVLASIGYNLLTPDNMLTTESGRKEADVGDDVLLEGITSAKVLLIGIISTSILSFVTNILLIVGVTEDKSHWIYVWLNAHVLILGIHILVCFCNMFLELPDELQKNISIYGTAMNIVLTLYFLVVVNEFYIGKADKIPVGFYESKSYSFFKSYGDQRFVQ